MENGQDTNDQDTPAEEAPKNGAAKEPQVTNKITVELLDNGSLKIDGPLHNGIICLGMLEFAKEVVHRYNREKFAAPPQKRNLSLDLAALAAVAGQQKPETD